jgi:hypothetical protein
MEYLDRWYDMPIDPGGRVLQIWDCNSGWVTPAAGSADSEVQAANLNGPNGEG